MGIEKRVDPFVVKYTLTLCLAVILSSTLNRSLQSVTVGGAVYVRFIARTNTG